MANTVRWWPGPTVGDEITSLEGLASAISNQVFARMKVSAFGWGETGTPPWYYLGGVWGYVANAGQPYLACAWLDDPQANTVEIRIRYSAALTGMLDPASWFPGLFAQLASNPQADWQATHLEASTRHTNAITTLLSAIAASGLCRSSSLSSVACAVRTYSFGAKVGQVWGIHTAGQYQPTLAEQQGTPKILNHHWSWVIAAGDAFNGDINLVEGSSDIVAAVSGYPQPVVEPGMGQASWQDLADGMGLVPPSVDGVKDAIDNALPVFVADYPDLPAMWTKVPKSIAVGDPEAVTHPDAQAGDSYTQVVASPPAAVFASGTALPAILATPTLIATLSKPVAIKVAAAAASGIAAGTMVQTGVLTKVANAAQAMLDTVFDKVVELVDWFQSPGSPPARAATAQESLADCCETLCENIDKIRIALERIADEVCRDPDDPLAKPGLVNAVELASEARSEVELLAHGFRVTAQTGVIGGDPEP